MEILVLKATWEAQALSLVFHQKAAEACPLEQVWMVLQKDSQA